MGSGGGVVVSRKGRISMSECLSKRSVGISSSMGRGLTGGKALEGFEEVVGHGFEVVDEGVPTGDGAKHSELVFGLVDGALAGVDEFEFGVGGYLEDFGGGVVGLAHGAHAVGGAGAAAGEEDAGFAGDAGSSRRP